MCVPSPMQIGTGRDYPGKFTVGQVDLCDELTRGRLDLLPLYLWNKGRTVRWTENAILPVSIYICRETIGPFFQQVLITKASLRAMTHILINLQTAWTQIRTNKYRSWSGYKLFDILIVLTVLLKSYLTLFYYRSMSYPWILKTLRVPFSWDISINTHTYLA